VLLAKARELGIELLISVGGDGSQAIAMQLHRLGLPVIGVPKTIDNDLEATVETFGFGTAVQVVTDALDRLRTTAESHDRIMVLEVMGRDAGWIALHAGIAGGADVILIPELPYEPTGGGGGPEEGLAAGRRFALIVVAEGAHPRGGKTVEHTTLGGGKVHGGAGQQAAEAIAVHLQARGVPRDGAGARAARRDADGVRPAAGDEARGRGGRGGAARGAWRAGVVAAAGHSHGAARAGGAGGRRVGRTRRSSRTRGRSG
jgi:6-phosphofructokinase